MRYDETRQRGNAKVKREALSLAIDFSGYTRAEVARRAGVSPQQISNLLTSRDYCRADTAAKIAKVFGQPTHKFFVLNVFDGPGTADMKGAA